MRIDSRSTASSSGSRSSASKLGAPPRSAGAELVREVLRDPRVLREQAAASRSSRWRWSRSSPANSIVACPTTSRYFIHGAARRRARGAASRAGRRRVAPAARRASTIARMPSLDAHRALEQRAVRRAGQVEQREPDTALEVAREPVFDQLAETPRALRIVAAEEHLARERAASCAASRASRRGSAPGCPAGQHAADHLDHRLRLVADRRPLEHRQQQRALRGVAFAARAREAETHPALRRSARTRQRLPRRVEMLGVGEHAAVVLGPSAKTKRRLRAPSGITLLSANRSP